MDFQSRSDRWQWALALLALVVPALVLPPIPIDETRYLGVAWNMHLTGQWLVPFLEGHAYPDKPPLLFWAINLGWLLTGVHAWSARLLEIAIGLATVPLLRRLAGLLGADSATGRAASWVWLGCLAFAAFGGAVMFDLLLAVCVLIAWIGTVMLARGRVAAGTALAALGLGLGILAKGPVSLLVGAFPLLLAPWWQRPWPGHTGRHYLALLLALTGAAAIALAWAIPAAAHGGQAYADAIFLKQTAGRVVASFAHNRGPAWYLPIVPLLLLPWALALGRGRDDEGRGERSPGRPTLDRFMLAATVPAFVAFSLISGKQPHYLLPLLPAVALSIGSRLADGHWRVVAWRVGLALLLVVTGASVAFVRIDGRVPGAAVSVLLLAALVAVAALVRGRQRMTAPTAATAMLVVVGCAKVAFVLTLGPRYSVEAVAAQVAMAQRAHRPLLQAGRQHGLYTFAGRLTQPVPTALHQRPVARWAAAYPDGWVISSYDEFNYAAAPIYTHPYLDRYIRIWRAGDIAAEAAARATAKGE